MVYIGTYTKAKSKGIYAYRFDPATGELRSLGLAAKTVNPSFLAMHPNGRFLYAVNEIAEYEGRKSGAVSAFAVEPKAGRLTFLNEVASGGEDPCHVSLDKSGKFVLVANYTGGSVAVFPVLPDGRLGTPSAFVQHHGSGVNPERQEGPHAHSIATSADNRFVLSADLGLDQLLVYRFDSEKGSLQPNDPPFGRVPPGAGPRHFAFSPSGRFLYVVNEMGSSISALSYDPASGKLQELQTVSSLPPNFKGQNDCAEIEVHASGKFLFASNRGHDSIAVFGIDPANGKLNLLQDVSTQGKTPRNFAIDPTGAYMIVANQDSDNLVVFHLDAHTGKLTFKTSLPEVSSPVCVLFAPST